MGTRKFSLLFLSTCLSLITYSQKIESPVQYVDSRLGTLNDGSSCVIGPQLPFGSINPSPQTPNGENDGYDPGQPIRGFGQLHVSGTGWGKYGMVLVSPQIGLAVGEEQHDSPKANESAHPYEYGVTLTKYNIRTEFTPSVHSAIYRFVFPESEESHILIDLSHNIPQDIATFIGGDISQGTITIDSANSKISGVGKYSGGFGGGDYYVYFTAEFNQNPEGIGTWKNGITTNSKSSESISKNNDRVGAYLQFNTKANDTIYMKISVSFKSLDIANSWLANEIVVYDYDKVKNEAIAAWNKELSKINIEGASNDDMKIFYTAMYHSMLMPRNRTNDMRGFADGAAVWDDQYAIWDTWRSLFPLMTLINPAMVAGNVNSYIERFKLNKVVKDAFIAGNDMVEEQGGNNVDNIIADAYVKGIEGVDWEAAYALIKNNAEADNGRMGWQNRQLNIVNPLMASYKSKGWIPSGTMSCSYTQEYAYNDYCAGLIAKGLGKNEDSKKYFERSTKWVNLWDPSAASDGFKGFVVPKNADGSFKKIDIKKYWGSWNEYFYEGSSWTYSFFAPHQFNLLVNLCGGKEKFAKKLEYGFKNNLIDYSNEPAFLAVHSFIYAGRPDLTSFYTRKLINSYTTTGLPGNDDSGATSSWYLFSSMGLFPNAGQDVYYLFGSMFSKTTISLANNKQLIIEAENASKENIYVQSCTLNGIAWNKAWLIHDSIKNGAIIKFVMGNKSSNWAKDDTTIYHDNLINVNVMENLKVNSLKMSILPNPSGESARVQVYIPSEIKSVKLKVYDNKGFLCEIQNIAERGSTNVELNGNSMKSGFYLLALECEGVMACTEKFVKL